MAGDHDSLHFRLPSESEWEYAARGGPHWRDGFVFSVSNNPDAVAWYGPRWLTHAATPASLQNSSRPPLAEAVPRATYTRMPTPPPDPQTNTALLTRREALARTAALLGTTLAAPTIAGVLAGCGDQRPSSVASAAQTLRVLTPAQEQLVAALAEVILPATDTPGARDVGVSLFVDRMLADYHTVASREKFLAGLARVDARAQTQYGQPFVKCTAAQQFKLVDALDAQVFDPRTVNVSDASRSAPDAAPVAKDAEADIDTRTFHATLKELTLAGYYTSEAGATRELRVNPMGSWRANVPYAELRTSWA